MRRRGHVACRLRSGLGVVLGDWASWGSRSYCSALWMFVTMAVRPSPTFYCPAQQQGVVVHLLWPWVFSPEGPFREGVISGRSGFTRCNSGVYMGQGWVGFQLRGEGGRYSPLARPRPTKKGSIDRPPKILPRLTPRPRS